MIHIIEGVPGSGKTYYAVNYLISNFYKFDDFYNEFVENENKNVLVITNIDNFRPKHLNLDVLVERFTLEKFFTVENFEKIQKQYKVKNIVVIIDEAQRYFDRKFYNKDVFYFFQYHRHLGVDIFLITQSKNTISKEIVVLAEYIVRAVPRSTQLGAFRYKFYDVNGNFLFSKSLKKSKNVFNAYKSMDVDEVSKPKNVILPKIIFAVGAFIFLFVSVPLILKFFWFSSDSVKTSSSSKTVVSKSPDKNESFKTLKSSKLENPFVRSFSPSPVSILVNNPSGSILSNSLCVGSKCLLLSHDYLEERSKLYGDVLEDDNLKNVSDNK